MLKSRPQIMVTGVLARHELQYIGEFCTDAHALFKKRLADFKKKPLRESATELEIDAAVDEREVLEGHIIMSAYYGVQMAFAVLERVMHDIYEQARLVSLIPPLRGVEFSLDKKWLKVSEYRQFFKDFGMKLTTPPFEWTRIDELQAYRNAIVHQAGFVTEQNVKALSKYKNPKGKPYKVGERLEIDGEYALAMVELVGITCNQLIESYLKALDKWGIEKK